MSGLAAALLAYFRAHDLSAWVATFVVVGIRLAPVLLVLPAQILRTVPTLVRTGIWLGLVATVATLLPPTVTHPAFDGLWWLALLRELISAAVASVIVVLPLFVLEDSGRFLDVLRGDQGSGTTLLGERGGTIAQLFAFLSCLLLIRGGVASYALALFADGFRSAPPFSRQSLPPLLWLTTYIATVMRLALLLVTPIIAVLLLFETALYSLARAASPIALHFLAQPLRQQMVLFALVLGWPAFWLALQQYLFTTMTSR